MAADTPAPALLESAADFRALFEAALDALLVTDDAGVCLAANPAALQLFRLPRERLLGRRFAELAAPDFDFARFWEDCQRTGWARVEFRITRGDGELRTVECSSRAAFLPGRHVSFLRDITERLRLEEEVRHAQKMEVIGRLVGGIAHDFNNLLTAVMIYSGLLQRALEENSELRRYVEEIQAAAERGSALVAQLLTLGRRQVLEPRVLSLGDELESMRDLLQRTVGEDIGLVLERATRADTVRVDPTQLQQVVLNLVLNARDAMPQGGRLVLEVDAREATGGGMGGRPGCLVQLQVRDSGCGMEGAVRARIFEPFFTTKARGKGSGLGLPMVESIVRQSGGTVEVETVPHGGTTVRVALPWVEDAPERRPAEPPQAALPAPPGTLLLVEDEELVRHALASVLSAAGYGVLTAGDAKQAMAIVRQRSIDLLVSDLVLPGANGRELAAGILRLSPRTQVVLISGYDEAARGKVPPGWKFLKKPFPPQRLVETVTVLLQARK